MNLKDYLDGLRGKRVAVLGMGISNEPLVKLLAAEGLEVTVRDKRELPPMDGVKTITGPDYLRDLTEDVVFRTPGIRPDQIPLKPGAVLTSEMEAFFQLCPCPVFAITGSDGKTTTTTILSELLKAAGKTVWLGGNIGHPLLDQVDRISPQDCAVVELSSFQLMSMSMSASTAIVTNVQPNHLDWHRDMDEYSQAKKNVFLHQDKNGLLVLNGDDPVSSAYAAEASGKVRFFSRRTRQPEGCWFDGETVWFGDHPLLRREEIKLPGLHNIENYMAAFCAVYPLVGEAVCRQVAGSFGGVEHRLELVREKNGVRYINDSIASSPSRTIAGLRALEGQRLVLIAGGYDKHIPYAPLGAEIPGRVRALILTGPTGPKIREAVLAAGGEMPLILEEADFRQAVLTAAKTAEPGETVLLSPASASFDAFKNFEERGETFKTIVNEL
jgi:UDP-N-acetylmuramoylalanine--D-glutamate ligase